MYLKLKTIAISFEKEAFHDITLAYECFSSQLYSPSCHPTPELRGTPIASSYTRDSREPPALYHSIVPPIGNQPSLQSLYRVLHGSKLYTNLIYHRFIIQSH